MDSGLGICGSWRGAKQTAKECQETMCSLDLNHIAINIRLNASIHGYVAGGL
jgi:hypothetical protein